jgi:phosphate-selective porin OprO/OprP
MQTSNSRDFPRVSRGARGFRGCGRRMRASSAALLLGTLIPSALALAPPAWADDDKRFDEEILEILRDEGKISEERYEELKKKEAEEAAARDDGWTIKYSNGLKFLKDDGSVKFDIGGRIQADFSSVNVHSIDLPGGVSDGDGEGVELRRARFYMGGELYERVIWKSQINFTGGEIAINDMYIGMKDLGPLGTATVGNQKEPFSLEELTSSKYVTFQERSLPSVFDPSRNFGLLFQNAICDKRVTWAAGIFAPSDNGDFFSHDAEFHVTGRVTGLPLYRNGGRQLIHVGASGSYQVLDKSTRRYRQRPEVHNTQRFLDTADYGTNGQGLLGLELAGVFGPVHVEGEYKHAFVDLEGGKEADIMGYYVQAGWFLTGENRPYKTSDGTWGRVSPTDPFDPANGSWGAIELAVRESYLDLNGGSLNGGKERDTTVGVNWYLYSNLRLTANYVYADVRNTGDNLGNQRGDIHTFEARAQLEF